MRGGNFTERRESRNVWVLEENQNSIEKSSDEKACVSKKVFSREKINLL